jgi:hypothetical protein
VATRLSPVRRARAARVLRAGGSWQAAADAAKCDKRTIGRLLKQPDFLNLTQGRGILQAGPLRIVADDSATLDDTDATESVVWIATTYTRGTLNGSRGVRGTCEGGARVVGLPPG